MRRTLLVLSLILLALGVCYADSGVTVNFTSNNTFYCSQTNPPCDFMGNNGGVTQPMWTTGDFVSETFVTGQNFVNDLTANWGVVDRYGNNPGATYENDVYINGVFVGSFLLPDCNFCGTLDTIVNTWYFAPILGAGTYNLSIVLAQTAAPNAGSEWFSVPNSAGAPSTALFSSTPEPGSLALLGSGVLGLSCVFRRRFFR